MKILYADCFCGFDVSMLLGALINMGAEPGILEAEIKKICPEAEIKKADVKRCAIEALRADIYINQSAETVACSDIAAFTDMAAPESICRAQLVRTAQTYADAALSSPLADKSVSRSRLLSEICTSYAALLAIKQLNTDYVICSHLREGSGINAEEEPTAIIPSPVTLEILKRLKIPFDCFDIQNELIPPWSAAFLSTIVNEYGPMPQMDIIKTGYGAGAKDYSMPNLIRTVLGEHRDTDLEHMFESSDMTAEFTDEFAAIIK